MNLTKLLSLVPGAVLETLTMMFVTCLFAGILGLYLGHFLYLIDKKIYKKSFLTEGLSFIVDGIRSFPFSIFIIALLPLSKWVLGSSFGMKAAFLPMIFAGTCYFARLSHQAFHTLPREMLDAAVMMSFTKKDLLKKLILPETLPLTIQNLSLLANASLSFSTMAGLVGAGGLGKLALDYGYYRFNLPILLINIFLILLIGKVIQFLGEYWFKKLMIKRGLYGKS